MPTATTNDELARAHRFWSGHGRVMTSVTPGELRAGLQRADLPTRIAAHHQQLPKLDELPGLNPPSFYPDFGTVSQARYWGCQEPAGVGDALPFVNPAAMSLEDALAIQPKPVDDPEGHAALALQGFRELQGTFGDRLWLRTPDAQGVLNTAGMILEQSELLMSLVAEPEDAQRFLDRVCDWLIELWGYLRRESGQRICGSIWPGTFLPCDVGASFTEDLMPLLSPELYRQFGIPLLKRIQAAFGRLHIHCCGTWGRHAATLADSGLDLAAVEFHYPYTRIEELAPLPELVVLVPYIALDQQAEFADMASYYHHLLRAHPRRRFWFALVGDDHANVELARSLQAADTP